MLSRNRSSAQGYTARCSKAQLLVAASLLALGGCGEKSGQTTAPASTAAVPASPSALEMSLQTVQQENQRLKDEVSSLKEQVADLRQTPQVLLESVQALVKAESLSEAKIAAGKLEQRYGPDGLTKTAKADIAKLEVKLEAIKEQSRQLEARGFYALKPLKSEEVNGFVIKVESLVLGNRWLFNSYDSQYNYRDVQRGEKFVLLKTTLQNTDKSHDPRLPDISVYSVEGKTMRLVGSVSYEFRRWSSYGSYIGLYHDFKNDFAHTGAIPFTAAASIDAEVAKSPFAVVATGLLCHTRGEQIGQPDVVYRESASCGRKNSLSTEDFNTGDYRVLAFFNKPKGV